ncbi:MAG TPA: hypothetical protein VEJ63_00365 [Planctomycetota bacterium]|nr:hypothetical protein [Planctomycetota bacterium]
MSSPATLANTTTAFGPLDTTSTLRPARLQCPDCARYSKAPGALTISSVGKVDFYHCADCGGAWFQDKGVDDALYAASYGQWPAPVALRGEILGEAKWACPCCQGLLVAVNDCRGSGARVRRCLVCYGGFIEHADLMKTVERSPDMLSRVGRFVRRLLR